MLRLHLLLSLAIILSATPLPPSLRFYNISLFVSTFLVTFPLCAAFSVARCSVFCVRISSFSFCPSSIVCQAFGVVSQVAFSVVLQSETIPNSLAFTMHSIFASSLLLSTLLTSTLALPTTSKTPKPRYVAPLQQKTRLVRRYSGTAEADAVSNYETAWMTSVTIGGYTGNLFIDTGSADL